MKFIVNSQTFAKEIQALSGVLSSNNNTVPIINCFLFQLEDDGLKVTATDLETTLQAKIALEESRAEGVSQVAVPAKILLDTLKTLDNAPLTCTVDPVTLSVELVSGEGHYNLAGMNPETFPTTPTVNEPKMATMPASVLVEAITKTAFAASTDEMRQQMAGIFMRFNGDGVTIVATDAHKLVRYSHTNVAADEEMSFILPRKPITLIKNILAGKKEDVEVTLQFDSTNVTFSYEGFFAVCRLVEGKYPNIEAAIPKENPNHLHVNRQTLLNTLRRVSIFASQSTHQVRLAMKDSTLQVSAEDMEFSNHAIESMPCTYEGEPMEIGFNARFLMEMVNNINTETIRIEMSHPGRAGIIYPNYAEDEEHQETILMLVMPVMLAN
ncbi:MAG: DNA polymerase III subunit beta [Bacteroidales bacterium]|nr:DNA polymerase III subunit beta [Bacteroidales bacterium]